MWLIGWLSYTWWNLFPRLSGLGKSLFSGVCVGGVAFAVSLMLPPWGGRQIRPDEIRNPWLFARGAPPGDPTLRSLWHKYRRSFIILVVMAAFMLAYGVAVNLGLAKGR